jgi:alpha-galactosidase
VERGAAIGSLALASAFRLPLVAPSSAEASGFVDLTRPPDSILAQTASGDQRLTPSSGSTRWAGAGVAVTAEPSAALLGVGLEAPTVGVKRLGLRWRASLDSTRLILGDAWERGYGDLEWRGFVPDRVMPWYVATWDGALTHSYGVRTGARAMCFWQIDAAGITLWADVRSGGVPLVLGQRTLSVCDVVCRAGKRSESAFAALHAFCGQMCLNPRAPAEPVYGSNDWYYAYGKNSAATVRADAEHIVELSPGGGNRPYVVIDDGWQPGRGATRAGAGTWDRGNDKFPDLPALAADVTRIGAKPGLWMRVLQAPADAPDGWRLTRDRNVLDPTVADVRVKITADLSRVRDWGFALIKHDYSSFDLFGRYGSTMGSALTRDGWTFAEGAKRTTAEVINELYTTIRAAAGNVAIIGCNTVSHLSAGQFEICRVGDDTSGTEWTRTRKMGVNTLAFRGAQHGAFYTADADCVGVTAAVPWERNRQWLDLLARSGTMLFVSLAPDTLGDVQRADLRAALALAARPQALGEPLDWQRTIWPSRWRLMGGEHAYDWGSADGLDTP